MVAPRWRPTWEFRLGLFLVLLSVVVYTTKLYVLGDVEDTYTYIFNSLGFLPLNVLIVTLILNQLLAFRARRERLEKLNMVIGIFFSEAGTALLTWLSDHDPGLEAVRTDLVIRHDWSGKDFARVRERLAQRQYRVAVDQADLVPLKAFLVGRREFFLRLLENPTLLEHEEFTGVLRAVFHLTEELEHREDLAHIPASDLAHLTGDVDRVYGLLVSRWMDYMHYLKDNYPYLFSLAMRTNPFDRTASPVVGE
jgi:hypothetical protein